MNLPSWFACASVMDLVPYFYYSYMRIWNGHEDVLVLGHWEPCPPEAKEIPFLHPYLSHFWNDEREGDADTFREVPLVLGIWKGTRNKRYTGQCFIGTEEDWQRGGDYDTRPNLEVDEEGIPIGCCTKPIGTDGAYYRKVFEGKHWSTLVRTGDRDDGAWHHERSFHGIHTTSAHYDSVWFHRRAWNGVYETTDHFAGLWHHERSWGAVMAATSHYASEWHHERSGVGVYETLEHKASAWDQERSYGVTFATSAVEPIEVDHERSWSAVVKTSAHHAASWDQEDSWLAVFETLDHFAATYAREHQWSMVKKTTAHYAAAWDQERSWQAFVVTPVNYAAGWHREHDWSMVYATVDNVQTFTCGTAIAAGSTQGTATALANDTTSVTSTGANQGVILAAGCYRMVVKNNNAGGGNNINVYPPSGAKISNAATNAAVLLAPGSSAMYVEISATQWHLVTLT